MRQLAEYIREREGFDSIITEEGFASYRINGEEAYIRDIWVERDYRKKGIASALADRVADIARKKGCKYLTGTVLLTANDAKASVQTLLAYGMDMTAANANVIFFRKDL